MTKALLPIDSETILFDGETLRETGASLHERYISAEPYPHICLDDVFPEDLLERVRLDTEGMTGSDGSFNSDHEMKKTQRIPERLPLYSRSVFYALNSRHFLRFLEELTGIKGLIPDPYFIGGGVHETTTGGYLDIHADFNHHTKLDLERRLNVLIYLNRDWQPDYGGCFEIWDSGMKRRHASIAPVFNRMVVFSTASDTMHGNPEPVNHPGGESRRSMALYYYTATWDDTRQRHTTIFKGRPGTKDASGRKQRVNRVLNDILPPVLNRQLNRVRRRIGI